MTHIDTYSHRIPHKLTQLHTNTHILHTFTHKLPHLWVGHKKSHVYIYISIYIYNKINSFIDSNSTQSTWTQHSPSFIQIIHSKTNPSIKKQNKQMKIKIKSFIQS